jgi:methylated-DNA-[protein]-cysteine S-methyltransferase
MKFETPFGPAWATLDSTGAITAFSFRELPNSRFHYDEIERQVNDFFSGKRQKFNLPLAPKGSEFQKRVWAELCKIPFAETISYGELARRIGNPAASRAVGRANATNPIAVIVPCHRVIGTNGKLTGYAGGLDLKEKLLGWERAINSRTASYREPPAQTRLFTAVHV